MNRMWNLDPQEFLVEYPELLGYIWTRTYHTLAEIKYTLIYMKSTQKYSNHML